MAPHGTLQECVGVVVEPRGGLAALPALAATTAGGAGLPGLTQLCAHGARGEGGAPALHPSKWPFVLVLVDSVPRSGAAGKVSRIRLAKVGRCRLTLSNPP